MSVRNFYIDCEIDGRKHRLTGGPRSKDGGFEMTITMREEGSISDTKLIVRGEANPRSWKGIENELVLTVSKIVDGEMTERLQISKHQDKPKKEKKA